MRQFFFESLKPLYYFLTRRKYRAYYKIFSRYSRATRYEQREVGFLGYKISVADPVSFAYQFREIFIEESYKFVAENNQPVIFDCGANIGLSCLYFLELYPQCRIKAFEADPAIFSLLKKNIENNARAKNIELHNVAVWTDNKGVSFSQEGSDGGSVSNTSVGNNVIQIPSVRLKELIASEKLDFLKIDIEGSETEVLLDCKDVLKDIGVVFFEYHSLKHDPQRLSELLGMFQDLGFRYFIQSPSLQDQPLEFAKNAILFDLQLNVYCYKTK